MLQPYFYINIKFFQNYNKFKLINYFFLINNFNSFSFFNNLFLNQNFINLQILKIKKNFLFFSKNSNRNRFFLKNKIKFFKNKIKYNKLIRFFFLNKKISKISKKNFCYFPSFYFLHNFYFFNKLNFFKNWTFLIGNSLSPYYWDLYTKKKWLRRNIIFSIIRNNYNFNYSKKNYKNNKNKKSLFSKKIFINNFFYLRKMNINYTTLNFFLKFNFKKISLLTSKKNNYNWFLSKPYLFLNNYENIRFSNNFNNAFILILFKNYFKLFNFFKKLNLNFRLKRKNDIFFKKIYFFSKTTKLLNNAGYSLNTNLNTNFSFFRYKNYFFKKTPLFSKKKKHFKKKFKFYWLIFLIFKGKLFKKYKFISKFRKFKFFNYRILKISKRLKKTIFLFFSKKINSKFKFYWFKKKSPKKFKIKYTWKSKNCFLNSNNFSPFCKFLYKWSNNKTTFFIKKNFNNELTSFKKNHIKANYKKSKVFKNFNKIIFISRNKNNFLTSKYGFLLTSRPFLNSSTKNSSFYAIKKFMYSFSYKNEIQRFILKRYLKNNFFNFSDKSLSNNTGVNLIRTYSDSEILKFDIFSNNKSHAFSLLIKNISNSLNWRYLNSQINFSKNTYNDESNFVIKRVRFKPGYMNLWRDAREVLKLSLNLSIKYQTKLTKYLLKYNNFVKFKTFLINEMSLFNILNKSRFFTDQSVCKLFLKNNLIYVNGLISSNENFQLFVGDLIQLIINIKYYILYKWILNLSLKKKIRLKNVARKKINSNIDLEEKKRSNSLPKWILYSKNIIDDCSSFIEVDYFTLSVIILYEPFLWSEFNPYSLIDQRFGIINLFNWKYIT